MVHTTINDTICDASRGFGEFGGEETEAKGQSLRGCRQIADIT